MLLCGLIQALYAPENKKSGPLYTLIKIQRVTRLTKSGKAPYLSEDELLLTLDSLKGKHRLRNYVILYFSHFLGLRAKELAALKVGDVYDSFRGIPKETVRLLGAYTKGNKYREVFLVNNQVKGYLIDYLLIERIDTDPQAPLFLSQKKENGRNGHFSADSMQRMIAIIYKKAGVNASSHSGRRSFATNLINKNADIFSIQQLMGHSSIQTTQEYFSSNPNKLKEQLLKLNQ